MEDGKSQFNYHSQTLGYLIEKIPSINLTNVDLGQRNVDLEKPVTTFIDKLEPSAGFGPATITLPR